MTDFNKENVQSWRKPYYKAPWTEEHPYRKCPNCGRYKFRALRQYNGGLFSKKQTKYWEQCDNCKYKGDEWTEDR